MSAATGVKELFEILAPHLDERMRRIFVAAQARVLGHGGKAVVCAETGVSARVMARGSKELQEPMPVKKTKVRREGGGRKRVSEKDPQILSDLESLVDPATRGDPESPLKWTSKSTRKLSEELNRKGHQASHELVSGLLKELGYSLQANQKSREMKIGRAHV